jgi:hypothetical protein
MQAYENKPLHMLDKTNDDEPVCMCVLQILIIKRRKKKDIALFLTTTCKYTISYKNLRHIWHIRKAAE